jgi:hypothetical protein
LILSSPFVPSIVSSPFVAIEVPGLLHENSEKADPDRESCKSEKMSGELSAIYRGTNRFNAR